MKKVTVIGVIGDDYQGQDLKNAFVEAKKSVGQSDYKVHLVNTENALKFKKVGSITFTTIFRAKGNEANIVFVINAHKMSSMLTYSRNRLFTAMTRAKFKTYVYGINGDVMETLCSEYEEVKAVPYDMLVSGADSEAITTLRLWKAQDIRNFNMELFSQGQYVKAVEEGFA